MKRLFVILVLSSLAFAAASCSKDTPGDDPVKPYIPQACQHDSLFFVPGVDPTESTCGTIEHYECPVCHAMFLDKECAERVDDDVIWAKSYVLGVGLYYENLDGIYSEIDATYKELSGTGETFAFSVIGNWLFKKVLEPKLVDMLKSLFAFHDKKGQGKSFSPEVQAIVKQLSQIENQLKRIADYFQEKEINERVDKRQYEIQALRDATVPTFEVVMSQIEGYTENDVLPQGKIDTIKMAVQEWYEEGITFIKEPGRPKDPYYNISAMLDYINGTWSSKSFPELYDHIAMRSTPWAREGNNLREAMRSADILSLTEAYVMLSLYYYFNPKLINQARFNLIKAKMKAYCECMERFQVNPVEENAIRWWWHDKQDGSKLDQYVLDKSIFHFEYLESNLDKAIADHKRYDFSEKNAEAMRLITEENIPVGSFLEFKDYKLIYKYLSESRGDGTANKTLYEGIKDAGFTNLMPFKDGGRIVYRSGAHGFCGEKYKTKSEGFSDYLYYSARYGGEGIANIFCLETALNENAKRMERRDNFYRKNAWFKTIDIGNIFKIYYLYNKGERTGIEIQGVSRSAKLKAYEPYVPQPKSESND